MTRAFHGLLFAIAAGTASVPARADPPGAPSGAGSGAPIDVPVYVLTIWTDDADDQADALTQVLRAQVGHTPGWSLVETNQSFETLAIALKCPTRPDPPCLARIGEQLNANRYVWGSVKRSKTSAEVSAEVHLWTRGKPDAVARESYGDALKNPNDEALRAVAAALLGKLSGAMQTQVIAPPPPAAVERADVAGGRLAPNAVQAETPGHDEAPGRDQEPPRGHSAIPWLGYAALVAGGGLLVGSAIEAASWVADGNASADDRKSVPQSVKDVCAIPAVNAAAEDACRKSKDAVNVSTLGWVFGGAGAALIGVGVWLLLEDGAAKVPPHRATEGGRRPAFEVVPSLGPRAGAIDLRLTY